MVDTAISCCNKTLLVIIDYPVFKDSVDRVLTGPTMQPEFCFHGCLPDHAAWTKCMARVHSSNLMDPSIHIHLEILPVFIHYYVNS